MSKGAPVLSDILQMLAKLRLFMMSSLFLICSSLTMMIIVPLLLLFYENKIEQKVASVTPLKVEHFKRAVHFFSVCFLNILF